MVGVPSSWALLGGFAIGARVSLLWQHSTEREMSVSACTRSMPGFKFGSRWYNHPVWVSDQNIRICEWRMSSVLIRIQQLVQYATSVPMCCHAKAKGWYTLLGEITDAVHTIPVNNTDRVHGPYSRVYTGIFRPTANTGRVDGPWKRVMYTKHQCPRRPRAVIKAKGHKCHLRRNKNY